MGSFIIDIAPYLWILCIVILLAGLMTRSDKSSMVTLTIWIVSGLLMDKLAPQIMAIEDKQIARNLWYLTWVVIDCVSIVLVLLTHKRFKLLVSELTRFISHTYAVLIAVQALRFFDRMIMETDLLGAFYMYAIPTLDIAVIAVSLIWLLGHLKQHKHNTGS